MLVGRYRLVELLGRGGFGAVYRGIQYPIERSVAVKLLHGQGADSPEQARRFLSEAKKTSRLKNPHTVHVYDFGQAEDGAFFMAMELVNGRPLSALRDGSARIAPARLCGLMRQVCESLEEAHAAGIIHRDLKPDNIMVEERAEGPGFAKVLDFGIAKATGPDASASLSQSGSVHGTPSYMSPEQCQGHPVTPRSDLYALGVIMFQMLAGRLPFIRETPIATLLAHVAEPPADLGKLEPELPEPLVTLVARLLAKDESKRPETAATLGESLDELVRLLEVAPIRQRSSATSLKARPLRPPEPLTGSRTAPLIIPTQTQRTTTTVDAASQRRRWLRALIAGAIVVSATGVTAWRMSTRSENTAARAGSESSVVAAPPPPDRSAPGDARQGLDSGGSAHDSAVVTRPANGRKPEPVPTPEPIRIVESIYRRPNKGAEEPLPRRAIAPTSELDLSKWTVAILIDARPKGATIAVEGLAPRKSAVDVRVPYSSRPRAVEVTAPGYVSQSFALVPLQDTARKVTLIPPRRDATGIFKPKGQ